MRKLIYFIFFAVFVLSVLYKARIIERQEQREIVSVAREWGQYGKPVDTLYVEKGDVYSEKKISGLIRNDNTIDCEVTEDTVSKLWNGQPFTASLKGKKIRGYVSEIDKNRNILTGLYGVKLKITTENGFRQGRIIVAKVRVGTLKDVLKIPREAVMRDNSNTYCWVVSNSVVEKRRIKTGLETDKYIQVLSGLKAGEQVCVNGLYELKENDKVRARNTGGVQQ